MQKATINTCKPVIVWIFFLAYPGKGRETFVWLQVVGFVILIFGTLMYNEIFVIPFWGFNENTQDKIDAREEGVIESLKGSFKNQKDVESTPFLYTTKVNQSSSGYKNMRSSDGLRTTDLDSDTKPVI